MSPVTKEEQFVLIVEDNEKYRAAAQEYLSSEGLEGIIVPDYDSAMSVLNSRVNISAVITDCFFPKETGSGDTDLGEKTIEDIIIGAYGRELFEMASELPNSPYSIRDDIVAEFVNCVGQVTEEELNLLRNYASFCVLQNPEGYKPLLRALNIMVRSSKEEAHDALFDILKSDGIYESAPVDWDLLIRGHPRPGVVMVYVAHRYFTNMRALLDESENNQPLGVLIAEESVRRGIPAIICSDHFHHDKQIQAIVDYYHEQRPTWKLVADMGVYKPGKNTPEAWKLAHEELKEDH